MNISNDLKIVTGLVFLLIVGVLIGSNYVPKIQEVKLNQDKVGIRAGDGEVCDSPFRNATCMPGYSCYNVTVRPYVIGVCYPDSEIQKPDFKPSDYRVDKLLKDQQGTIYYD